MFAKIANKFKGSSTEDPKFKEEKEKYENAKKSMEKTTERVNKFLSQTQGMSPAYHNLITNPYLHNLQNS